MRPAALVIAALLLPIVRPVAAQLIRVSPATDITAMGRTTQAGGLPPLGAAEGSSTLVSVVRTGAEVAVMGGVAGFLVGGVMNIAAGVSSIESQLGHDRSTDHPCGDKNCAQIGAVIGAAAGFVLGAAFGAVSAGRRPSSGQANVRMAPLHDGRLVSLESAKPVVIGGA